MSIEDGVAATRRRLTGRRAETVTKLTTALPVVLREVGYQDLTLQRVAEESGLARATAYIYFSSKDHLIAEVYWRQLNSLEMIQSDSDSPADRVVAVLRSLAMLFEGEPEYAEAVSVALLGTDSDVIELRSQIAREIRRRIRTAVGETDDPAVVDLVELIYTGAMTRAGTGHVSFAEAADVMEAGVRRIL
ncbi:TetR/AcrR family transcriptional regulator [Gordonia rhizosphera]|uniref:Putative TetR family transcriptional regulator n=1 Tax=Gordonia rhizosphera NBRC 16068 TaxID=1108045 RepID=K6X1I2_9ACTN|nr:helix-turn-helix domain-containing protein [Gordonia rhizosphera]GAB92664.1 putative TetR family transcriptional regulator [Gordonia rhizosphera NBRC 16068]